MRDVIQTATNITKDTFKQLEAHIRSTDDMVTELKMLLERKEKQLQSVRRRVVVAGVHGCVS